jgi:hypothetical protein
VDPEAVGFEEPVSSYHDRSEAKKIKQESNLVVRCTPEAEVGARVGGERLLLWSAALMRCDFLLFRVNADGKQTGETNTEGETPMRFFSSP